jgi:diacylglycerol kinase (ATP)
MPPRVAVVINARAGGIEGAREQLRSIRTSLGNQATWFLTETLGELAEVVQRLRHARIERVVVCGGDGTHCRTVSALVEAFGEALPQIVLIRLGTVGTLARAWAPDVSALGLLTVALGASRGVVRRRPCLRVQVTDTRTSVLWGFTLGAGLVAHFFEEYQLRDERGALPAMRVFLRVFLGSLVNDACSRRVLAPVPATLTIDERPCCASAYNLVVCSVLRDVGLGLRVTYRAEETLGRLHLVASSLPAHRLGRQAPRVLLGRPLLGEGIVDVLAERWEIAFPATETVVLDGECLRARGVRVEPGPLLPIWTPA